RGLCKRTARIARIWIRKSGAVGPAVQKATNSSGATESSIQGRVGEVPLALQRRGYVSTLHLFLDQTIPFLRRKEKGLAFHNGPDNGKSEIVAANRILL